MLARCIKVRGKSEKRERLLKPMQMSAVNGRRGNTRPYGIPPHGRTSSRASICHVKCGHGGTRWRRLQSSRVATA